MNKNAPAVSARAKWTKLDFVEQTWSHNDLTSRNKLNKLKQDQTDVSIKKKKIKCKKKT